MKEQELASPTGSAAPFIDHLQAFRACAILAIVAVHVWPLMIYNFGGNQVPILHAALAMIEALFHGSTLYFALISGILFSLVLEKRGWGKFYSRKLLYIVVPYLLLSAYFYVYSWFFASSETEPSKGAAAFFSGYLQGVILGKIQLHYWYIPILLCLFAITPVLSYIVKHRSWYWLAGFIIFLPLIISRTTFPHFISPQTLVYFTGAYTLGIGVGYHYRAVQFFLRKTVVLLTLFALACSAAIYTLFYLHYETESFFSPIQSLIYLQKILFAGLGLYLLKKYEQGLPKLLLSLGRYAFVIYFLHITFMFMAFNTIKSLFEGSSSILIMLIAGMVVFVASIALSMAVGKLLNVVLKKKSRLLVGF